MVCIGLINENMLFKKVEYDYYAGKIKIGEFISTTTSAFEYCAKQHYFANTDVEASVLAFKIGEDYSDYDDEGRYNGHYGYDFYIVAEIISIYDYEADRRNELLYVDESEFDKLEESEELEELEELEAEIYF